MPTQKCFVEVVEVEADKVVKRMGPLPERAANKCARGVEINLNHDAYFVRVVAVTPGEE